MGRAGIWSLSLSRIHSFLLSLLSRALSTYSESGARDTAANLVWGKIDTETSLFDYLGDLLQQRCTSSLAMVGEAEGGVI